MELRELELVDGFPHMKGSRVLKVAASQNNNCYWYGSRLYDLESDPEQCAPPIRDEAVEMRLLTAMRDIMVANEAPEEQFIRMGIPMEGQIPLTALEQKPMVEPEFPGIGGFTPEQKRILLIGWSLLNAQEQQKVLEELEAMADQPVETETLLTSLTQFTPHQFRGHARRGILNKL